MALTDQPYLPLYVRDWLSNLKLKTCKAESHGVLISIMCLMHLSDDYGKILLNQKFKQHDQQIRNFVSQLVKFLPFEENEVERGLSELIYERVLKIEDDFLVCKRMIKDNDISLKRSKAGFSGGKKTQFAKAKKKASRQAKTEANTAIANAIENKDIYVILKEEGIYKEEEIENYRKFNDWLKNNASKVLLLKEPITIKEMLKLQNDGFLDKLGFEKLKDMHNCKDLLKKYESANLTLRKWVKREDERNNAK